MGGELDRLGRIAIDESCRRSFLAFVIRFFFLVSSEKDGFQPSWHHRLLCHEFEKILRGEQRRLMISVAPRTLKSIIASVLFPAWALGQDPKLEFICASYSMELALKLARDCRTVMENANYQRIFPGTRLDAGNMAAHHFQTTAGGGRRATSVGGTLTGLGADHIICDDVMNATEAGSKTAREAAASWMGGTMRSRLNNPKTGTITLLGQRLHKEDPIGRILELEGDFWNHIDLPAIAETRQTFDLGRGQTYERQVDELLEPNRVPQSALDELRRSLGTAAFNAQYQQRPVSEHGNLVRKEWFVDYDFDPRFELGRPITVYQSWDLALKDGEANDYSVCITLALVNNDFKHGDIYIMDVFREKLIYPDLRKKMIELARDWQARSVIVEDKGSGISLIQDLKREGALRPIAYNPLGDKNTRLSVQSAKIEQGRVFLPHRLAWAQVFLAELLGFPNVGHDDQVDALTQFLDWLDKRIRGTITRSNY